MTDSVQRLPDSEVDGEEGWDRLTDEPEIRGVEALLSDSGGKWPWQVTIWVAEFLREDPLQSELHQGLDRALRAVPGVLDVANEDTEVWVVAGTPTGDALVAAAAQVVDTLADRAREHIDGLDGLDGKA